MENLVVTEQGFTLIELLVTVAIVGILASISMANFEEFRGKAYDTEAQVTVVNFRTALNAKIADGHTAPFDCRDATCINTLPGITSIPPHIHAITGKTLNNKEMYVKACSTKGQKVDYSGTPGSRYYNWGTPEHFGNISKGTWGNIGACGGVVCSFIDFTNYCSDYGFH